MSFQLIVNGISSGAVYALIAVGFALVFSVLKFSNFAHGGTISACAFVAYFVHNGLNHPPLWVTILLTCLAGMVIAYLVDLLGYTRLRKNNSGSLFFFLSSVTFAILIEQILNVCFGSQMYAITGIFQNTAVEILGTTFSVLDMTILAAAIILLLVLILVIEKTRLGLAIRAVAISGRTSRLMGINSSLIVTVTLVIAGLLAGITGVMLGIKYSVFSSLGPSMMLKGFIASVIGGLGSLGGAIVAAILLGVVEIISVYYWGSEITPIILFSIMLIFLLIRPQGVSGRFSQDKA
ncbi:MAG TPA: branched-chain amino acid ABC transporter permease [Feifaniaceae bacterium]|nr:branched-chain amino acid ABC transporter permease [Feifaniaceae bacterium]